MGRSGALNLQSLYVKEQAVESTALTGRSGPQFDAPPVPRRFGNEEADTLFEKQDTAAEVPSEAKALEMQKKQELADRAAREYNSKYRPYQKALERKIKGVKETANGGVSFADSDALYVKKDGTKAIAVIEASGNRGIDFNRANEALGFKETPEGYVWHHVDNYNVEDNSCTLELVRDDAHNDMIPHAGSCAQYDAVNGPHYNPPRRG